MKAAWIEKKGGPLRIQESPRPKLGEREVLIRVKCFGLNFAEVLARVGLYPDAPPLPFVPGYEVSGIVEETGPAVSALRPGDAVLALTAFGGYAECAVADERAVFRKPEQLDWREAAALPVNALTAHVALVLRGGLREGERVLIQAAAGGVGLCALQIAKILKAETYGTAGGAEKCDFLRKQGLDHPIDYSCEDYEAKVLELTRGEGVDLILDSLGGHHYRKERRLLKANGRLCAIGVASMLHNGRRSLWTLAKEFLQTPRLLPYDLMMKDQAFIGINLKRLSEQKPEVLAQCFQDILRWVEAGLLKPVIARCFPFQQVQDAQRYLQERRSMGKVVVEVEA